MTVGEHTILIDGLRFHFRVSGEGADVVLLHGWGCSTDIWKAVEAELSKNFKVWNIDFPGFGQSEAPTTPWGVEEYTRNFEQFCAMNSISRPTLIGHSFGGRVSIVFASRNEVDKIVLVDAAGVLPPRGLKYYAKVYSYKAMKFLAPLLLGKERGKEIIDRRRRASGSSDYNALPEAMRGTFIRVVNQDLCPYMPAIKAPTLLVWGSNDTATPLSDAKVMNSLIDDSGLVVFEGAGHYSFLEQSARFNIVISNFLGVDKLVR